MANNKGSESPHDTELLILKAAEREFMTRGFTGARTTSIAEAAGVTHAMFHYYFRTKQKLFDRIISEKIELIRDSFVGSNEDMNLPLNEMLHNIIVRHLDFIAANPDLPRFLVGEIFCNPERAASFLEKLHAYAPTFIAFLQQKIDYEAAKGLCRKVSAKMLMLDILSLNVFPYMATPAINAALGNCMANPEEFLAMRKRENYATIMRKLKP